MKNLDRRRFEGQCFHQSIHNETRKHLRYHSSLIVPFSEFQNIKFCCSVDFFLSVFLTATVVFLRFQFQDYTSLFETFGLILLISVYALSCQTTNFMGCLPLADLCLSLADLHHFCLTKGFSKTPNAI